MESLLVDGQSIIYLLHEIDYFYNKHYENVILLY